MRFDITDMRLFLHVAEAGSITHGAQRSHIALASASARIRGMEESLGAPLLIRSRRGVETTEAGQTLLHHARLVLRQIEKMHGELGEYAKGVKGRVRLLCNTAALTEFLPEVLATFMSTHPNIDIDLEEQPSHGIVRAIAQGQADVGIVADSVDLAGLQTFPFRRDRLVVVAGNGHPLIGSLRKAEGGAIGFETILDFDLIGLAGDSALQRHLAEHAARAGRRMKYRTRLGSFDAICRMVENGVGIAVMPETAAIRSQRAMAIERIPLANPWAERQLTLCVRQADNLPFFTRQLIDAIKDSP